LLGLLAVLLCGCSLPSLLRSPLIHGETTDANRYIAAKAREFAAAHQAAAGPPQLRA
jgi:hypothetical protein